MRRSIALTVAAVMFILCSGCLLRQLDVGHYDSYFEGGSRAFDAGDYNTAKRRFIRAYNYANSGFLGPSAEAAALYNYALAEGMLGQFPEAEKALNATLALDAKTSGEAGPLASLRWLNLARLYQAWGKLAKSASAYERGISFLDQYGRELDDPICYAIVLEDYAKVLSQLGRQRDAEDVKIQAKSIRDAHPGAKPKCKFLYYPAK